MKTVDFFCGAGGLTRGLLDAGFEVAGGFDIDKECRKTYEHNNQKAVFHCLDIRNVDAKILRQLTGQRSFREMLFAGCAPCQPFSKQRKGGIRRQQATLLGEFGRLIDSTLPRAIIIENVPGMARVKGNSTFKRFLNMLHRNKYSVDFSVLDAKAYGVSQTRRRLVLVAARGFEIELPSPRYGIKKRPIRTVRDVIAHFPTVEAGEEHTEITNHSCANISELNLERLQATPHDGGSRMSWPKRLHLACHSGNYKGHSDVYGRMAWDSPAPTLTAKCNSISNGRYGHPEQNRAISLREAAALQSFPDRYEFFGSNLHIARQIGNAVPVKFAEALGRQIAKTLSRSKARVACRRAS